MATIHISCKQEDIDWLKENQIGASKLFQAAVKDRREKDAAKSRFRI